MHSLATLGALLEGKIRLPGTKNIFHFVLVKANPEILALIRQLYTVSYDYNLGSGF